MRSPQKWGQSRDQSNYGGVSTSKDMDPLGGENMSAEKIELMLNFYDAWEEMEKPVSRSAEQRVREIVREQKETPYRKELLAYIRKLQKEKKPPLHIALATLAKGRDLEASHLK